jgi:hypothetical protein
VRIRAPASIAILFRCGVPMPKSKVAGERGAVELLCQGQHLLGHGWHRKSLDGEPLLWEWARGRTSWSVPVADLPIIPAFELTRLMARIGTCGALGSPIQPTATTTGGQSSAARSTAYAATERLRQLFMKHNDLVKPAMRELIAEIGATGPGDRHDSVVAMAGRLVLQKWTDQQAIDFLVPAINGAFGESDWNGEIYRALAHARSCHKARFNSARRTEWC